MGRLDLFSLNAEMCNPQVRRRGIDAVILEISREEFDQADIVRIEDDYKSITSSDSSI